MDTTGYISTPDLTTKPNANYGELVDFWNKGNAKIEELQNELDQVRKSLTSYIDNNILNNRQMDSFVETLIEYVVEGEIEESVGDVLAGCFGRDLTRKVSIHVRAEGDVEVIVPLGYNIDELGSDLSVLIDNINCSDIDIEYEDIQLVEVEVQ
jgi:hypothetical protein